MSALLRLSPLFYLCTGVTLNLYAQALTDLRFSRPEAHLLPCVKFIASLTFAALGKWRNPPTALPASPRQRRLMALIGLLDATAYVSFCIGFAYAGTAISSILLSGSGQVFTALSTRLLLRKRLSRGQWAAVALVTTGLLLRALPPQTFGLTPLELSKQPLNTGNDLRKGVVWVIGSSLLYTALGVTYEALVGVPGTATPPYPDILWHISTVGATGAVTYQAVAVAPRWRELVAAPMAAAGLTPRGLALRLAVFGTTFNVHMFMQSKVFKTQGALGVTLVNAVRGALIAVAAGVLLCSPTKPELCLTVQSGLSAAVVTAGGLAWALAGAAAKRRESKEKEVGEKEDKKTQ